MSKTPTIRIRARWLTYLLVVVLTAAVVAPATAFAAGKFTDVPGSNTFHGDISWLANAGVTKGCNPPADTLYCPNGNVSRAQMAAFLRRFAQYLGAEDGTPAQADNAGTVGGKTAADLGTAAYSTYADGVTTTTNGSRTVLTLDLPAGSYVIFAKATIFNSSGTNAMGRCRVTAGTDYDESLIGLTNTLPLDHAALALNVVHTFATAGSAVLTCDETLHNADISVYGTKITAIQVTSLSNAAG